MAQPAGLFGTRDCKMSSEEGSTAAVWAKKKLGWAVCLWDYFSVAR
jgi:hypothetical protein